MNSYATLYRQLEEKLASLYDSPSFKPENLFAPQRYILSLGGKRLRPLLALIVADMMNGDISKAMPSALCVELFHNFSLIHDDILDKAPLRRGKKTVHKKWNTNIAILSGDAMLVRAYQELQQSDKLILPELLKVFNATSIEVCVGQQEDMDFESMDQVSVEMYKKMITGKTAVLLACSMQMGALCAGVAEKDAKALYECGKHLGIAFQLKDDLLDVFGDSELFGKQVGGDIISNKKTFLLLMALEKAKNKDLKLLHKLLGDKRIKPLKKVALVKSIYESLHIREITEMEIQHHFDKAIRSLNAIKKINAAKKKVFVSFCRDLMGREK